MTLKLLTALVALALIWWMLFRPRGRGAKPIDPTGRRQVSVAAQDLVKCRRCGIYLSAGRTCDCTDRA